MKKKIAILGSTGSIGKQTLELIKKDKKNFEVIVLSTNKNLKEIKKQIRIFKPKNVIITDIKSFKKFSNTNKKIKVFKNYNCFKKIFKKKVDYTMSSISSFDGLQPTIDIIKYTKLIAIANKESIICGWNLIISKLNKFKTKFVPVDSEHFSIWSLIRKSNAIKHPKWKMGKKISIDSATMVNKLFEVIEAKKIFNLDICQLKILSHPDSYVHAIVKFNNGLSKILIHDTNMEIPIYNSLYLNNSSNFKTNEINFKKLNNLNLKPINENQFPSLKIIKEFSFSGHSLFETVLVSANDELVDLFLKNKIKFLDISKKLIMIMKLKEFQKLKSKKPSNLVQIINLNKYVRLKTRSLCVKSI